MGSIWHIGIAVPDLEKGQKELGEVFGLHWRPARVRKLTLADAAGRPYEAECHIGYRVDDLAAEVKRLDALGYPCSPSNTGAGKHLLSRSVRRTACVSGSSAPGTWAPR